VTTIEILNQLERLGVVATATPDGYLDLEPAESLTAELLETIKAHKAELLEHLATAEQDRSSTGPDLLPAQSPWLELSDHAQGIWDALEAQGTRALHLIDQDGRKACHCFTASKPSDLRELATRGLKTFPRVKRLTVIAVMPEAAIWQLEPRTVN
jgi:hypothetical protein